MKFQLKSFLQYTLITLVGGFFLYYVFKDTQWADLFFRIKSAHLSWLFVGLGVGMVSHWLRAYRATFLYQAMGYEVSTLNSFYSVLIGYMMNYVIPRAGEISRCAALTKTDQMPIEKSLGTVVTERIVDLLLLLVVLGTIFILQFQIISEFIAKSLKLGHLEVGQGFHLKWILGLSVLVFLAIVYRARKYIASHPVYLKLVIIFEGFADGLLSIRHVKKPAVFIILSFLIWACYILMMYFCLLAMDATSELLFSDCLVVFAIGTLGVVIPAPGAGAGTYHFFVMQSLLLFGVAREDGIAYATMVHGAQMILLTILGLIASVFVMLQHKKIKTDEQTA